MRQTIDFLFRPFLGLLIVTLGLPPIPAYALRTESAKQSAGLESLEESVRAAAGLEGFKLIRALDLRGLNKRVKMEPDEGRIKLLAWLRELPEQQGLITTPAVRRRAGLPPLVGIFGLRQTVLRLNGSSRIERRYGRGPGYRWEPLPLKEENFLVIGTDGQVSFVEVPPLGEDSEKAKALLALRKGLPSINAKGRFVGKASSDRPMESQGSRIEYGMQIRRGDRLRLPSGELRQITRIYASPKSSGGIRLNTKKIDPLDGGLINSPISFSIPELLKLDAVHLPGSSGKMPGRELAVYRIGPQPVPDSIELRDGETLFIRIWGNGKTPAESLLYVLRLLDAKTAAVLFGRFELEQFTLVENAGAPDFSTGAVLIEGNDWKQPSRMGKRRLKLDHPSFGEVLLRRHSQVGAWRFDLSKFSGSLEIFSLTSAAGMEEDEGESGVVVSALRRAIGNLLHGTVLDPARGAELHATGIRSFFIGAPVPGVDPASSSPPHLFLRIGQPRTKEIGRSGFHAELLLDVKVPASQGRYFGDGSDLDDTGRRPLHYSGIRLMEGDFQTAGELLLEFQRLLGDLESNRYAVGPPEFLEGTHLLVLPEAVGAAALFARVLPQPGQLIVLASDHAQQSVIESSGEIEYAHFEKTDALLSVEDYVGFDPEQRIHFAPQQRFEDALRDAWGRIPHDHLLSGDRIVVLGGQGFNRRRLGQVIGQGKLESSVAPAEIIATSSQDPSEKVVKKVLRGFRIGLQGRAQAVRQLSDIVRTAQTTLSPSSGLEEIAPGEVMERARAVAAETVARRFSERVRKALEEAGGTGFSSPSPLLAVGLEERRYEQAVAEYL